MQAIIMGKPEIVMQNPDSKHHYFGWPTVARLRNGRIAVVASGFRLAHICPFGKTVIAFSEDEGATYTRPAPVIDTVLDDRDGGIVPFGSGSVIVTSFNHTVAFHRECTDSPYQLAYLDTITPEEEAAALGATFRFSHDNGVTFGPIFKSPVTSPHGPVVLPDGSLLWVGTTYSDDDDRVMGVNNIQAYRIHPDGHMTYVGEIENPVSGDRNPRPCEPHAIVLDDGTLLVHIRVQHGGALFTTFQSESSDGGRSWTKPHQILSDFGGAPSHLMRHSSGTLIAAYGFRGDPKNNAPFGIRVMFSRDQGQSWDIDHDIYRNDISADLGYPSTVELRDGSLLTVFYAIPAAGQPAVILQQQWRLAP